MSCERLVRQRPARRSTLAIVAGAARVRCAGADRDADDVLDARARARRRRRRSATARRSSEVLEAAEELSRLPGRRAARAGRGAGPAGAVHDPRAAPGRARGARARARRPRRRRAARGQEAARADAARVGAGLSGEQRMLVHEASTRARPRRLRRRRRRRGQDDRAPAARRRPPRERRAGARCGAERPGRRRARRRRRHPAAAPCTGSCSTPSAEGGLPHGCVLVVDEAGHGRDAGARAAARARRARRRGRRSWSATRSSCRRSAPAGSSPPSATGSARSTSPRTAASTTRSSADALEQLRDGDPEAYLAHAARRGRLHVDDDADRRQAAAARGLVADRAARPRRHGDARLPARRRPRPQRRRPRRCSASAGRLGPDALEVGGREFRVGDRVLCRRNDERLGVRNGTRATVVDRSTPRRSRCSTDGGAPPPLDERYAAEHLEHGYALTGHAAQGATVERAFVLLRDQGALREWGYVACTRARTETRLYAPARRSKRAAREPPHPDAIQPHASQARSSDQAPSNSHPCRRSQTRAKSRDAPKNAADASASRRSNSIATLQAVPLVGVEDSLPSSSALRLP